MEAYWVFRLFFVDPEGRTVWQSLSALHATGGERQRRSADIRAAFDPRQSSIRRVVSRAHAQSLEALRLALKRPMDLTAARERDIMTTLQQRHARMAADLLQRGLFDRRVERLAAAQSQLVEHALLLTTERLHVLNGLTEAAAGGHELVFAIAIH
jgi:hypothetical protein